jgi:hypothetical protein
LSASPSSRSSEPRTHRSGQRTERVPAGTTEVSVTCEIGGLEPRKRYGARLVAKAEGQTQSEGDWSEIPPAVTTNPPRWEAAPTAQLSGAIQSESRSDLRARFEYQEGDAPETLQAEEATLRTPKEGELEATAAVTLTTGKAYRVRLVAEIASGNRSEGDWKELPAA